MEFMEALEAERIKHGWSKSHLSEVIGIKYNTLCSWYAGTRIPSMRMMNASVSALGMNKDDIELNGWDKGDYTVTAPKGRQWLVDLRVAKGLSQGDISRICGLFKGCMHSYELGRQSPNRYSMGLIADALNMDRTEFTCKMVEVNTKDVALHDLLNIASYVLGVRFVTMYNMIGFGSSHGTGLLAMCNHRNYVIRGLSDILMLSIDEAREILANKGSAIYREKYAKHIASTLQNLLHTLGLQTSAHASVRKQIETLNITVDEAADMCKLPVPNVKAIVNNERKPTVDEACRLCALWTSYNRRMTPDVEIANRPYAAVARLIRKHQRELGLQSKECSDMIGCDESQYTRIFNGKMSPPDRQIPKYAEVLNIDLFDLVDCCVNAIQSRFRPDNQLSAILKYTRLYCGMMKVDIAKYAGICHTVYGRLENSNHGCAPNTMLCICQLFDLTCDEFTEYRCAPMDSDALRTIVPKCYSSVRAHIHKYKGDINESS